jgi:hypothetical protein
MSPLFRRTSIFTLFASLGLIAGLNGISACGTSTTPGGDNTGDENIDEDTHDGATTSADDDDDGSPGEDDDDDDDDDDENTTTQDDDDDDDDDDSDPGSDDDVTLEGKFDLGEIPDLPPLNNGKCGIDFLFVIDNSRSMEDEQKNLIASFPGFIDGIRTTLETDDFQVLVIDSDANGNGFPPFCNNGDCTCIGGGGGNDESCCQEACADPANKTCAMKDCSMFPPGDNCDVALGAGRIASGAGADCMIEGDRRFMLGSQSDLDGVFECAGDVGIGGSGEEKMMLAMNTAVSEPFVGKDGCNEDFLRDDTVLVVVFITDEEEKQGIGSPGAPKEWYDTLVAAKGAAERVVMIGFYGDVGQPGALCDVLNEETNVGAEESPRLREFVDMFGDAGLSSSVCAPDFGPAFTEAIGKIDAACDLLPPK